MDDMGHILIVRGASAAGRSVAGSLSRAGAVPSVLDRRTSVSGAPAVKVDLRDLTATGRGVAELVRHCGPIAGLVLFASPDRYPVAGARPGQRWERALADELVEVATILRAIAPAMEDREVPLLLVEGPHPKLTGRPVRGSADDVVSALVRGLVAELSPQVSVRPVRFVAGQETVLLAQVLGSFEGEPHLAEATLRG